MRVGGAHDRPFRLSAKPAPNPLPQAGEGSGANNFDLIRLAAALLVLGSHAFILTGRAADEPVARATFDLIDGGGLAVAMFFVLSGYLIAGSAQRHAPGAYLRARALRIYPAFLVAVALQTFVLGPFATTLPALAYLGEPAPWLALARAVAFSVPPGLPGVFGHNPLPGIVNGSLWTLRIEALCYLGLLALSCAGFLRRGRVLLPLAAAWAGLAAVEAARAGLLPAGLASLRTASIVDCGLHFMMGAAAWAYRDLVPWRGWLAAGGLVALGLASGTRLGPAALHLVLPILVLWLGHGPRLWRPGRDVSYGIYLYAFPVQQAMVAAVPGVGPFGLMALAAPMAVALGAASAALIERPALRLR